MAGGYSALAVTRRCPTWSAFNRASRAVTEEELATERQAAHEEFMATVQRHGFWWPSD